MTADFFWWDSCGSAQEVLLRKRVVALSAGQTRVSEVRGGAGSALIRERECAGAGRF